MNAAADSLNLPEAKPLRSYLDKILFGVVALLLTIAIARLDTISTKVDEAANKLAAVSERVDGTRERLSQTENRLDRLERAVFESRREDLDGE